MRKTIVITDLTQMPQGDRVCIAGIDETGTCIRPVVEPRDTGVPKSLLYRNREPVVIPRARIEFDLHPVTEEPPHIEDMGFDPQHISNGGVCSASEWNHILSTNSYDAVNIGYDNHLQGNAWMKSGARTKSLITLRQPEVLDAYIKPGDRSYKPRLKFRDAKGELFDCPVTDLALWNLCGSLIRKQGLSREKVLETILQSLTDTKRVYLRLGLARPLQHPSGEQRCYLLISAVHTFPDYLKGKTFADF